MFDRPYLWKISGFNRSIVSFLVVLWLGGCATLDAPSGEQVQGCDKEADAAVERQDWEDALMRHQALLIKEPGNCLAIYHLGYIYGKLGDRTEETEKYESAVRCGLDSDDRLFYNLGMAYAEMNFMDEALAAFEKAVGLNPLNEENHFGLGLMAQTVGQTQRAKSAFQKAVEFNPRHWESRIMLVRIFLDQGQLPPARAHLEKLRANVPDHEEVAELWQIYQDRRVTTYDTPSK